MPRKKYIYYTSTPQTFLYVLITVIQFAVFALYTLRLYRDLPSIVLTTLLGLYVKFCYDKFQKIAKNKQTIVTKKDLFQLENKHKDLKQFYEENFCTVCKFDIPPRVFHCQFCMKCYEQPLVHSVMLGKCIGKEEHISYFKLLIHHFLLIKFSGIVLVWFYFVQFQNLLLKRGFNGIANTNDIFYTFRKVKQQFWGLNFYFCYITFIGLILFYQIITNWKKLTMPFKNIEKNYLAYNFYIKEQILAESALFVKNEEIDYKDKNDLREIILNSKIMLKKFEQLYNRKSIFSVFK